MTIIIYQNIDIFEGVIHATFGMTRTCHVVIMEVGIVEARGHARYVCTRVYQTWEVSIGIAYMYLNIVLSHGGFCRFYYRYSEHRICTILILIVILDCSILIRLVRFTGTMILTFNLTAASSTSTGIIHQIIFITLSTVFKQFLSLDFPCRLWCFLTCLVLQCLSLRSALPSLGTSANSYAVLNWVGKTLLHTWATWPLCVHRLALGALLPVMVSSHQSHSCRCGGCSCGCGVGIVLYAWYAIASCAACCLPWAAYHGCLWL